MQSWNSWGKSFGLAWAKSWGYKEKKPTGGGGNILPDWEWPPFPVFDDEKAKAVKRKREEILLLLIK
jgi:hypothetical protein